MAMPGRCGAAARGGGGDLPPALLASAALRPGRGAAPRVAAELFDTGANMGPAVATTFLQRALTALNRGGKDYPDLMPDGRVGPATLSALDAFWKVRGKRRGETVLLRALEALQGERYLRLAERRPANEAFLMAGWRTALVRRELSLRAQCASRHELCEHSKENIMAFSKRSSGRFRSCSTRSSRPQARDRAKLELIKLQGDQEMAAIGAQMQAIVAEAQSADPLDQPGPAELPIRHVRADPVGDPDGPDRGRRPAMALGIGNGMTAYLRGMPEELYALFGTGYLGYTAAHLGEGQGRRALGVQASVNPSCEHAERTSARLLISPRWEETAVRGPVTKLLEG